ncbi:MAG: alternative ribosome rescue aminoacyl-tRNA hydrolase ArfB [Actinomycetota bacterium]|nr:alternative ribosome rescue aminoacyl-tRNA hydrolase ArfB [Actinomycetota bacterium]
MDSKINLEIPETALTWRFSRSSGPGGQSVNKADTKVELICDLRQLRGPQIYLERIVERYGNELRITVSTQRSQLQNRQIARHLLKEKLEKATKIQRRRHPTKPTPASKRRRLDSKKKESLQKAERRLPKDE